MACQNFRNRLFPVLMCVVVLPYLMKGLEFLTKKTKQRCRVHVHAHRQYQMGMVLEPRMASDQVNLVCEDRVKVILRSENKSILYLQDGPHQLSIVHQGLIGS